MREFTCCVALVILVAYAMSLNAQVGTNTLKGLVPTNNIAAARSLYPLSDFGRIAPNTPAFEEYSLNFMLARANAVREKWQLDIPKPLTVNDVLFQLRAKSYGIDGSLGTRDKRYEWGFSSNNLGRFRDHKYSSFMLGYKGDELVRLATIESKITAKEAEAIARDALHRLGLTEKQLHLKEPPAVNQYKWEGSDNKIHFAPLFTIAWRLLGDPEPESGEFASTPVTIDVSGITKKVVEYFNVSPHTPRDTLPTNYFQMLGLSTNYLETLPAKTRMLWGLPPLTNSAGGTAF